MEQPILSFLTAYFSDLHIQCRLTDRKQLELADLDLGLRNSILMQEADAQKQAPFPFVQNTIYFIVDYYECNYSFFRLPDKSAFLFVGPFLWKEFERSQILSLINRLDIPAELFPQLQEYYHALPLIADKASMTALLRHVYQTLDADADVSVQTLHLKDLETRESFLEKHQFVVPEDPVLSMHLLEERHLSRQQRPCSLLHGGSREPALCPPHGGRTPQPQEPDSDTQHAVAEKSVRNGRPPVLYRRRLRQLCAHD